MGEGNSFSPDKFLEKLDQQTAAHGIKVGVNEAKSVPPVDPEAFDVERKKQAAAHGIIVGQEATEVPPLNPADFEAKLDEVQSKHQ